MADEYAIRILAGLIEEMTLRLSCVMRSGLPEKKAKLSGRFKAGQS